MLEGGARGYGCASLDMMSRRDVSSGRTSANGVIAVTFYALPMPAMALSGA
jgi:hypothetical protein